MPLNPNSIAILQQLESNPAFVNATYNSQINMRTQLFQRAFANDAQFNSYSAPVKERIFRNYVFKPPKFKSSEGQWAANYYQGLYNASTPEDQAELRNHVGAEAFGAGASESLVGRLAGWLGRKYNEFFVNNLENRRKLWGALGVEIDDSSDPQVEHHLILNRLAQVQDGEEFQKLQNYQNYLVSEDRQLSKLSSTLQGIGGATGFVLDLAAMYGNPGTVAMRGAFAKVGSALSRRFIAGAAARGISGAALRAGGWALRTALPSIAETTVEGLLGVTRDNALRVLNGETLSDIQKDGYLTQLKSFGQWAGIDYLIDLGISTIAPWMKNAKNVLLGKKSLRTVTGLADDVFSDYAKVYADGGLIPEATFQQLKPAVQDHFETISNMNRAAQMGTEVTPFYKTSQDAFRNGLSFVEDAGQFRLRPTLDNNVTPKVVDTLREAQDIISARAVDQYTILTNANPEAAEIFKISNQEILNFSELSTNIDEGLDMFSQASKGTQPSKSMHKQIKSGEYIPQTNRGAISFSEMTQDIQRFTDAKGFGNSFPVTLDEKTRKIVSEGGVAFTGPSKTLTAADPGTDKALMTLRNPADPATYANATAKAEELLSKKTPGTLEEIRSSILIKEGYDGAFLDETKKVVETFYPDKIKILSENIDALTGKYGKGPNVKKGPQKNVSQLSETFTTNLPLNQVVKNKDAYASVLQKLSDNINTENVKNLSEAYLRNLGFTNNVNIKLSQNPSGYVFREGTTLIVPSNVTTPLAKKNFMTTLTRNLDELSGVAGNTTKLDNTIKKLFPDGKLGSYSPPIGSHSEQLKWVENIVTSADGTLTKSGNKYFMTLPGKGTLEFNNLDDLTNRFVRETMSPAQLKSSLAMDGQRLIKSEGIYKIKEGSKTIATGSTIGELLQKANITPKLDISFSPEIIAITPSNVTMKYTNLGAIGDNSAIRRFLTKYTDYAMLDRLKKVGDTPLGNLFKDVDATYRITMPAYGIDESFATAQQARKFMKDWSTPTNLTFLATKKGLKFNYEKGMYVFREGGKTYKFKNIDSVGKFFADQYPDPSALQDIFQATDDEVISATVTTKNSSLTQDNNSFIIKKRPPLEFKKDSKPFSLQNASENYQSIKGVKPPLLVDPDGYRVIKNTVGMYQGISQAWQPFGDWFYKSAKEIGLPEILPHYRAVETGIRNAAAASNEGNKIIKRMMSDSKGKLYDPDIRRNMYYALAQEDPGSYNKALEDLKLEPEHLRTLEEVRSFLGTSPTEGLFRKFGIDPNKWVNNYAPRIKAWAQSNAHRVNAISMKDMFKEMYGDAGIPKQVGFWAENERASEFIRMAIDDDLLTVLTRYNTQGNKKIFLNDAWNDMDKFIMNNRSLIPDEMYTRLNVYREQVMGIHYSNGEKMAKKFGESLMATFGKGNLEAIKSGGNLMSKMFSLNYMTTMGWRPYLAIRNMMQPWTTLAPRFGNSVVTKAIQDAANPSLELVQTIERLGSIGPSSHLVNVTDDLGGAVERLTEKSLKAFGNSDAYTRAVAYRTAELQLDDALTLRNKGTFKTPEQFIEYSGLNLIDNDLTKSVMDNIEAGNIKAAKDIYGTAVIEDTMFSYRTEQTPMVHKGLVGKLFGQYGTYSAGFRANLVKGFTRGSKGQRAAFISRYIFNSLAIMGALSAVGVRAQNFIPFAPVAFTGGPMFDLALNAIRATDFQSFKGRQARAELDRFVPGLSIKALFPTVDRKGNLVPGKFKPQLGVFTPFNYQIRAIQNFNKFSSEGKSYQAWLSLTSAPISPDWGN
jgi:hypothetical protein